MTATLLPPLPATPENVNVLPFVIDVTVPVVVVGATVICVGLMTLTTVP